MKLEDMLSAPAADDYNGVVFAEKGGEGDLSEYIFTRRRRRKLKFDLESNNIRYSLRDGEYRDMDIGRFWEREIAFP